jgi:branched-subunit amino acid ABC-type transport system permease component
VVTAALPFTTANLAQQITSGLVNGTGYALVAVGFGLIITVTGRFHIAYGATYALSAFIAGQTGLSWGMPFWAALVFGVLVAVVIAGLMESLVYWPLNRRLGAAALMTIFIASLGLSTAGENAIALLWNGAGGSVNITGFTVSTVHFLDVYTTNLALVSFFTGWAALLAVAAVIRWTRLGRMIRAVRVNQRLSLVLGISPRTVYLVVFALGTALGGIGAVFTATQSTATFDMGSTPILYAITVSFIAGGAAPLVVALVAVGVGLIESLSIFLFQPQWSQVVVFACLLVYVLVKVVREHIGTRVHTVKPVKAPEIAEVETASQLCS